MRRHVLFVAFVAALSSGRAFVRGATLTVDLNGGADYTDIQSAIDAAADGDTVVVKPGEYVITDPINFNRLHDLDHPESPPVKNLVLKSEGGAEVTTIRMSDQPAYVGGSVVVFEKGEDEASVLDGFSLTGGSGKELPDYPVEMRCGGGVYCEDSSPTLTNCTISGNSNGGMYCKGSSPTLMNCTISENSGYGMYGDGSAILTNCTITGNSPVGVGFCGGSSPTLRNCTISGNSAYFGGVGGGVLCHEDSSPTLIGCTITGNPGGGVCCSGSSSPTLRSCTISGNPSSHWAGVYCGEGSSPTLTDCIISGNSNSSVDRGGVYCGEGSFPTFTNCTISGNSTCGVYCDGPATLRNCTIAGNSGSGLYCTSSSPTLTNCKITRNSGGGVGCWNGSPTLTGCTITENSASWGENGGIHCTSGSFPTVTNCTISGNGALRGGGVHCVDSSLVLANCIVWDNAGGSLFLCGTSRVDVSFSCIETEGIWPGEGNIDAAPLFCGFVGPRNVYVEAGSPDQGDGSAGSPFHELAEGLEYGFSLQGNSPCIGTGKDGANMGADEGTCESRGSSERVLQVAPGRYNLGGITLTHGASILGEGAEETVLEGTVWGLRTGARLSGVTVTGGRSGGIVLGEGECPAIEDCTISGNSAGQGGGVFCMKGSSPTLTNCMISGNWAANNSGGLNCVQSSPTLINCAISGNSAYLGGGVYCYGVSSPTFTNCAISGNSAYRGGGVCCYGVSSPTFTNCTISGNRAEQDGGGVYSYKNSFPLLTNCTISGNSAEDGGGVECESTGSSLPTLTNSLIWGNIPDSACGDLSHCLTDRDPLFVHEGGFDFTRFKTVEVGGRMLSLPDFILEEPDYRILPGSPAIDAGTSEGAPATDIEGNARPCGAGVDIGAYEFGDCWPSTRFRRGDSNADGTLDILDPAATLGFLFLGDDTPACLDAADANDDGKVDISDAVANLSFLFLGGRAPPVPGPKNCGIDPTADGLGCESPPEDCR